MTLQSRLAHILIALASPLCFSSAFAASNETFNASPKKTVTLSFGGTVYLHRWSKAGQNEFTPESDKDLERWHDMVTINVHEGVRNGDQLAELANSVLSNYQRHGKIVRTDSKPRTPQRPAEHLIVALLGNPGLLEVAYARMVLVDGVGMAVVYSHRAYGNDAAGTLGEWLKTKGPSIETILMTWDKIPSLVVLRQLPQSQ